MDNFSYGRISYQRRFSINLPLSAYDSVTLYKVLKVSSKYVYHNVGCTDLHCEVYIHYHDESNRSKFLKLDLHDYTFKVEFVGDSSISF